MAYDYGRNGVKLRAPSDTASTGYETSQSHAQGEHMS